MRLSSGIIVLSCSMAISCAQPAPPEEAAPVAPPTGDLGQVMQGILFPNSNIIFDAQEEDPGAPADTSGGRFAAMYAGWQGVENAAIALAESADLIMMPGRVCSNGAPVPIDADDYAMFAEGLRAAGLAALAAAEARDQDQVIEVTGQIGEACALCHEIYRDTGPAGSPSRCVAQAQ